MNPHSRHMALIGLFTLCLACPVLAEQSSGIHVSGRGTLEIEPDMGEVVLNVRREGTRAAALKTELDRVVSAVLKLSRELGIDKRDVTASALSITPRYQRRDNESVVEGLIASRRIEITLRDLDTYGDLLNESLALGVNNTDPIRLDTTEREVLEDRSLVLAMEDARAEAAKVAAGFDVELGPVTDVQVGGHSPRPEAMRSMAMDSGGGDFSPGVIRVERFINATFSIIPRG